MRLKLLLLCRCADSCSVGAEQKGSIVNELMKTAFECGESLMADKGPSLTWAGINMFDVSCEALDPLGFRLTSVVECRGIRCWRGEPPSIVAWVWLIDPTE